MAAAIVRGVQSVPGRMSDIREILEALEETGDQSLREEALDACALRILTTVLRLSEAGDQALKE